MTLFVHLASAKNAKHLRRSGIQISKRARGVYAIPVVPDYFRTHQWMRELRKWGRGQLVGVYFRVPDTEVVAAGRYAQIHEQITAASAASRLMQSDDAGLGFEVIISHSIAPTAIQRIRFMPYVVGWRHFPHAHGRRPCGCPACVIPGEFGARRLRQRYQAEEL